MNSRAFAGLRCGLVLLTMWIASTMPLFGAESAEGPQEQGDTNGAEAGTRMILGLSWQPGFCEGQPNRPECRKLGPEDRAARQLSLNGLWRARQTYCGVSEALQADDKRRKWLDLPEVGLDADLHAALVEAMPGVASGLDRHEWVKHGSCSGLDARRYYGQSLEMLDLVNRSAVGVLLAARLGQPVRAEEVRAAFDTAFGAGAGDRIRMRCRKDGERQVITGITIGLGGAANDPFATRLAAAGRTAAGCAEGILDMVGSQ